MPILPNCWLGLRTMNNFQDNCNRIHPIWPLWANQSSFISLNFIKRWRLPQYHLKLASDSRRYKNSWTWNSNDIYFCSLFRLKLWLEWKNCMNHYYSSTESYINYRNLLQYSVGGMHDTSLLRNVLLKIY